MSDEPRTSPHPDPEPLRFLLGTWRGEGSGTFHTVEPFADREEMSFASEGGILAYRSAPGRPRTARCSTRRWASGGPSRNEADGDTLSYEILLGTEGQPFGPHLRGRLARVRGG